MLKPEQVPDEAVKAAMEAWGRPGTMKDVVAAAINAWPGRQKGYSPVAGWPMLNLPMPTEPRDE